MKAWRKIGAIVAPVVGITVFLACVVSWYAHKTNTGAILLGASALFGMSAGGCSLLIFHRLEQTGWTIPAIPLPDMGVSLYVEYWNIAPRQNWSRLPVLLLVIGFCFAIVLLVAAMHS